MNKNISRRNFLKNLSKYLMLGSLAASYGTFLSFIGNFLYPAKARSKGWLYVAEVNDVDLGQAIKYMAPDGSKIAIARQQAKGDVDDFIALSSTCPHLGCQVHWEGHNSRFFCPCHNGVFDPSGKPVSGPPADAGQSLGRYPLKIEGNLLFIQVPLTA